MAEHEAEMQRQMMSVPISAPGTQQLMQPPIQQTPNLVPPPIGMMPPHMSMPHNMPPPPGEHLQNQQFEQQQQFGGQQFEQQQFEQQQQQQQFDQQFGGPQQNQWTDEVDKAHNLPSLMSVKVDKPEDIKPTKNTAELILPKALEDVFAFKDQLAGEMGRRDGEIDVERTAQKPQTTGVISTDYADADADSEDDEEATLAGSTPSAQANAQQRLDKNKKKKLRRKQNRKQRQAKQFEYEEKQSNGVEKSTDEDGVGKGTENGEEGTDDDVTIEYVADKITVADLSPMYRQFYRVFEFFKLEEKVVPKETDVVIDTDAQEKKDKDDILEDDDDDMDDEKKDDKERLSKRKLKKLTRLSVAELKQLVHRPDVVEMHDVTARDPKLLVQLKAHRNTVQVPRHWCFKRKYLQGKRGIEKPPFDLPAFIKKTGIMEMRMSLQEKDEGKTLKAKMRERARPKMGKIDIDYQKLHDAFFKWQTKPRMTIHGDLYYEGKEFETRLKEKKPGDLSEELRTALGMPIGPNCHKIPPPWLIAQQRYGPPPSYPNLKIPGLNAPIPEGTSFGYHAGGWGKPPVDEKGKPLYGDVFGTSGMDPDVSCGCFFPFDAGSKLINFSQSICRMALKKVTSIAIFGANLNQNLKNHRKKKTKRVKIWVLQLMKVVWLRQPKAWSRRRD